MNMFDSVLMKEFDIACYKEAPGVIHLIKPGSSYTLIVRAGKQFKLLAYTHDYYYHVYFDKFEDLVSFIT